MDGETTRVLAVCSAVVLLRTAEMETTDVAMATWTIRQSHWSPGCTWRVNPPNYELRVHCLCVTGYDISWVRLGPAP